MTGIYFGVFREIPEFTQGQSQLIATLTSVIPLILIFSYLEGPTRYASLGKRKAGLTIHYSKNAKVSSYVRNIIKFLPWQIGHIGTISGIYSNYESFLSQFASYGSLILASIYCLMVFFRQDGRGVHDVIAGSLVVEKVKPD